MKNSPGELCGATPAGLANSTKFCVAITAIASLGVCALVVATHWGIGIYTDSIVYIGTARSILSGDGIRFLNDVGAMAPVVQYPPAYPLMMAGFGVFGLDPLDGARWISIVFYAGNALLAALIVYRATASYTASWSACFLSLSAFPMVYIHSQALTEPPFIFLILLGFYWIVESLEESRTWALYGASLLIGVSCLVRYVGIAFLPTGAAVILLLHRGSWKHRLSTAAKFMILGSLPFAGWVLRNLFAAGDAVNRTFGIHPPGLDDLLPALDTAGYWLLPIPVVENSPWLARPVMGILFVAIFCLAVKKKYLESRYVQAVVFCLAGYALFLFVSMSLNDQPLYFDTRTLALPYVTVMILTLSLLANWLQSFGHGRKSGFPLAIGRIIAVVLAVQMINGVAWLKQSYFDGIGFATEPWRTSELLGFAKQAPAKLTVFSNAPDFIYTLAGKPAAMIPRKVNPDNRQPNPRYDAEIDAMRAQLEESNGVIMYFGEDSRLWYLPSANELKTRLPLELFKSAADGKIYRLKTVSNSTLP